MVDSLAITSATPPVATPQATRAAASCGDDGCSNFARVLRDAHDERGSSTTEVQATASVNGSSNTASGTSETQTAVDQGSDAVTDGSHPSVAVSVESVAIEDNAAAISDETAPADSASVSVAGPASASADPANAVAQDVDRTSVRLATPLAASATATQESKATPSFVADHADKTQAAKHHGKKHTPAASDDADLIPLAQTPPGANSVAATIAPSATPSAPQLNGRAASSPAATPVRSAGPFTQALQTGPKIATADVTMAPAQAEPPLQDQQASDVVAPANTASLLQQGVEPGPPNAVAAASPRVSLASAAGPLKTSSTTRSIKDVALPAGNAAPDDSPAFTGPSPAGKSMDVVMVTAASIPPFAATLSRHVVVDGSLVTSAQSLTAHATFHPSQSASGIGTDQQAGGPLPQQSGEPTARSSALEVGFHDANLGWLSVRASTDVAGGLHAAVSAKTPAAVASVDAMLPSLGRFLQQENVAVHTFSTTSMAGGPAAAAGFTSASNASASSGASGSSAQQQGAGRGASQPHDDRNSSSAAAPTGRAASRLTSASTVLRYSQGEQLSTVSVRI